jgi:hypothetical protein
VSEFNYSEKLAAVRRELRLRRRVYPNRVGAGHMTPEEADKQLAVMEAIEEDYVRLAEKERLL